MTDEDKAGERPAEIEQDRDTPQPEPLRRDFYLSRETHAVEALDQVREAGR